MVMMLQDFDTRLTHLFAAIGERCKSLALIIKSLATWRVALTVVSGLTTTLGLMLLYDVFGAGHSSGTIGLLRYVIPVSLAGALHAAIYWALDRWSALRLHRYLLLALPLQTLAIAASYGTHWTHMRGDSVTIEGFEGSKSEIVRAIRNFAQSDEVIVLATKALSDHSEKQAKLEAQSGNSCVVNAGVGMGPRYDLRMNDRDTYASFNAQIADRRKRIDTLVDQAEKMAAASADEAISHGTELRRIVNEAKSYEADPLLAQLKNTAQQRLLKGRGPIDIPPTKRIKGGVATFACPDATLDRHLTAVIDAINGLKPVPEVDFPDGRDPRVGFSMALGRVATSLLGTKIWSATRVELVDARKEALAPKARTQEGIRREDVPPMIVATAIEAFLTLLFMIGRDRTRLHPGMEELERLIQRQRQSILDSVWAALGGDNAKGALRQILFDYTKFDHKSAFIIVPVYSARNDVQRVLQLMTLLTHVQLAKCVYTGRVWAKWYTVGWADAARESALQDGAVRVYRLSANDYLALVLDAANPAKPANDHDVPASTKLLPDRSSKPRRAA